MCLDGTSGRAHREGFSTRLLDSRLGVWAYRCATRILYMNPIAKPLFRLMEWALGTGPEDDGARSVLETTLLQQRRLIYSAILATVERAIAQRTVSPAVAQRVGRLWARALLAATHGNEATKCFQEAHGCSPPLFLVVSPGHACNLRCRGCYASADPDAAKLEWSLLDRVLSDAKEQWGVPLFVFSGGEPMVYRSEGHDLLDIVEKHADSLFLMFTNGTLIDDATAKRLARLGNLTPALSVEGFRQETDDRRGFGTYNQVLSAMGSLRRAGVPFGVSMTATRENADRILSDDMLDFYFDAQGAFYGFVFPYSPIGSEFSIDWIPTPEQSVAFLRRSWEVVDRRRVLLLDFWNHGPLVRGCIAAGRERGYLYVDWNANVMPCVFFPYAACNVRGVYANGGTLDAVWNSAFFQAIRQWQADHGYGGGAPSVEHNWLSPCPFRDHYADAVQLITRANAQPEDAPAAASLTDEGYRRGMVAYGREACRIRERVWEIEYAGQRVRQ